ncbi:MAG TPA: TerC family protein [Fimbriimonadaceae bacterium]|nr:TerC family protein [Fimbriimonadaceae bacterium]
MELANIPIWVWGAFMGFVLLMLALDLGVFHRHAHKVEMKEALTWSGIWIGLALAFNVLLFFFWDRIQPGSPYTNQEAGLAFLAGYLIEKALSVDNIFVFLIIFSYFAVPAAYQHRVLFWGIIGALIFRALFIAAGATLLEHFTWTMVIFGLFLILTGIKMALSKDKKMDPEKNPVVRAFRKLMPVTNEYDGQKFFTRINGKLWATPLFLVLLVVEFTDVIFAVDSIPAIFAITSDPFIVFTSNVFAILGLRALFFALAGLMQMFHYLSYGLAAILVFVGGKMLYGYVEKSVVTELPKFPVLVSLAVIVSILAVAIIASIKRPPSTEVSAS